MKKYFALIAIAALSFTDLAQAHAHLHKSEPAENSTVTTPKNVVLEFTEAVVLTAVTLQKGDTKLQDLGPLAKSPAKTSTLALPELQPGNYIVKWRALSDDSHVAEGKLLFTVKAP